jgi:hypothetical protein
LNHEKAFISENSDNNYLSDTTYIIGSFVDIAQKIKAVCDNSEQDFLRIGNKLHKFLSDSKDLFRISSSIISSAAVEVLENGTNELAVLLDQITILLSKSVENIRNDKEELNNIKFNVDTIVNQMLYFEKIVKRFRTLGVAIKIESSRFSNDEQGFNSIADNVEILSEQIKTKASAIITKSKDFHTNIEETVDNLKKMETRQLGQTDLILKNTTRTLNVFSQNYKRYYEDTNKISISSDNISKSINDIVISLQAHDITRQKLEHVLAAFSKLVDKNNWSGPGNNDSKNQEEFNLIYDVCELQNLHLINARDEFLSEIVKVINNLLRVEDNISSILEDTSLLLGEKSIFGTGSISQLNNEFNSISEGLVVSNEISNILRKTIKSIVDIIDDLARYIHEIEDVGSEIEMVAINARIKAARTGINGSSLDVLAEAIQNLSLESKNYTGSITSVLIVINDVSKKFKLFIDPDGLISNKENVDAVKLKIKSIIDSFTEIGVDAGNIISVLQQKVSGLKIDIGNTIDGIIIHKQVETTINQVLKIISGICEHLKNSGNITSNKSGNTSELLKKYTMHSERKIHQDFIKNNPVKNENKLKNTKKDENSFGDNVDLF